MALDEPQVQVDLVRLGERPEVLRTVKNHAPRPVDAGELLGGEPDHGIGLSVLEVDVVLRRPLLDQVVLENQRLVLGVRDDDFDVDDMRNKKPGLDVFLPREVRPDPVPQGTCLPDVDDPARRAFHEVHAGLVRILPVPRVVERLQ